MKRFLGVFLGLCFLILSGCSSVTAPEGVDSEFYKKWEVFYKEPFYNNKDIYKNYINKNDRENLVDFNRKDLISEENLIHFYGTSYMKIRRIIQSKTDYMTNEELFKNNLSEIEDISAKFSKVFILPYSNDSKWDLDKRIIEYYSNLDELNQNNISYLLEKEEYIVNVRFENLSTILLKENKLMTNGFGATVSVEKESFSGYYLKPMPRFFEIPLELNKAKNYDINNLEVLLYVRLSEIDERNAEDRPTLKFPTHTFDFRIVFEVQILGYQLRDKKSKEIITQGTI
ncbi:hypothetical protein [Fusobacterium sp.]|uniref:hypothetical protein n=1 Tax=Fusobacterium sp. TaxID=68766 RepID=UPI00396C71D6